MAAAISNSPFSTVSSFYSALELIFDDEEEKLLFNQFLTTCNAISMGIPPQIPSEIAKITGYAERIVPEYSAKEFRYHYRLSMESFEFLYITLEPYLIEDISGNGIASVEPRKMVLVFVWYMSTQESMREIAHLFGISISTTHSIITRLLDIMLRISDKIITWPDAAEQRRISQQLQEETSCPFEGIIGSIDGTHIRLNHRINQDPDYICRKKFPSIQLQIVVSPAMKILNFHTGWPGCVNDGRVLSNSSLYHRAERGELFDDGKFIIGDGAYPVKRWLIPVIKDNNRLSCAQKKFNKCLSSIRQVVERTIGHVKGRFRRLRCIHIYRKETSAKIIASACVLHNICIKTNEELDDYIDNDPDRDERPIPFLGNENNTEGENFRNRLIQLFE